MTLYPLLFIQQNVLSIPACLRKSIQVVTYYGIIRNVFDFLSATCALLFKALELPEW